MRLTCIAGSQGSGPLHEQTHVFVPSNALRLQKWSRAQTYIVLQRLLSFALTVTEPACCLCAGFPQVKVCILLVIKVSQHCENWLTACSRVRTTWSMRCKRGTTLVSMRLYVMSESFTQSSWALDSIAMKFSQKTKQLDASRFRFAWPPFSRDFQY